MIQHIVEAVKRESSSDPWFNSPCESFRDLTKPQWKGKVGVLLYKEYLERSGYDVRLISDEGDIEFRAPGDVTWHRDEVKTASADMKYRKRDGKYTTSHWFNQVRPNQKSWDAVTLVAVFPFYYQIYRMEREEYFQNRNFGTAGITPGHTGTDDLDQVKLVDNSMKNSYNEWDLIYEGV